MDGTPKSGIAWRTSHAAPTPDHGPFECVGRGLAPGTGTLRPSSPRGDAHARRSIRRMAVRRPPGREADMRDQDRLIRRVEVERLCALSTSSIYRLMGENRFPRPIRVGPKAVRWLESEIGAWVASRPRAAGGDRRSPGRAGGTRRGGQRRGAGEESAAIGRPNREPKQRSAFARMIGAV